MAEEALRRRFVFYAALKSRFTAPFSAANNSGGDDDNDADVDEQKERTKEKAAAATERPLSVLAHPLKYLALGALVPQVFSPERPLVFARSLRSIWPRAISSLTKTFLFAKKRREKEDGGRVF